MGCPPVVSKPRSSAVEAFGKQNLTATPIYEADKMLLLLSKFVYMFNFNPCFTWVCALQYKLHRLNTNLNKDMLHFFMVKVISRRKNSNLKLTES